jgi:hypothetical protein
LNKILIYTIIYVLLAVSLTRCTFLDDNAPIPMYLDLKQPTLTYGSAINETHNITEVWVFQDNQILGVFPLPAKVPILSETSLINIKILAGVRNNGSKTTPILYPFIDGIDKSLTFEEGKTVSIPLEFKYRTEGLKVPINETFEGGHSLSVDLDGNLGTFLDVSSSISASGARSGWMKFDSNTPYTEVGSSIDITAESSAPGASFLEFDYKGEGEITVGIAKVTGSVFKVDRLLFIPGKPDWNHIYVDLTQTLQTKDYTSYRIVFGFTRPINSISASMFIDNVKHLHF